MHIYNMKESVLIEEEQKVEKTSRNPVIVVLAISVIFIIVLNILNSLIFY